MDSDTRFDKDRSGKRGAFHKTDWLALEEQLNRTKSILQEILVHLQGVLHNLRSAKNNCRNWAKDRKNAQPGAAGFKSAFRGAQARGGTCNSRAFSGSGGFQSARPEGASAASDRFRARAQAGFGAKAKPGGPFRETAGDRKFEFKSSFSQGASSTHSSSSSKTFTSQKASGESFGAFNRDKARFDSTRSSTRSSAGASGFKSGQTSDGARQNRFGSASGQSARPNYGSHYGAGAQSSGGAQAGREKKADHKVNRERQERGRAAARRGEMNLKSAYDILCLDYPCNANDIKSAYRNMARMYHPDLGGDEEMMKDVNLAYELAMRFCSGPRRSGSAWAV